MIFRLKKKEESINHIDSKQQFTAITEYAGKLRYLYEVDIKTRNSFNSPEHLHFLKTFQIFQDSTSLKKRLAYKIHYTSIPSIELGDDLKNWFVFKLTFALNQKVSLRLLLDSVKSNLNKKNTETIKSRVVVNSGQVDASVYFEELTNFLDANHPGCKVTIINQVFHDN